MTFAYQFEKPDWTAFCLYHVEDSRAYRKQRFWSRFLLIPVALLFVLRGFLDQERDFAFGLTFFVVALVWFFAWPKVSDTSNMNRIKKTVEDPENTRVFGKRTMTLTPEGIHVSRPGAESTIAWDNVVKVVESQDHIFVYMSTIEAIVIPRLSLEGASFEDVKNQIQRHHAGSGAAAPTGSDTGERL